VVYAFGACSSSNQTGLGPAITLPHTIATIDAFRFELTNIPPQPAQQQSNAMLYVIARCVEGQVKATTIVTVSFTMAGSSTTDTARPGPARCTSDGPPQATFSTNIASLEPDARVAITVAVGYPPDNRPEVTTSSSVCYARDQEGTWHEIPNAPAPAPPCVPGAHPEADLVRKEV
jgi:hypothetical protein